LTLIARTRTHLRTALIAYVREVVDLLPKAARFLWLITLATLVIVMTPIYGILMFSLWLWGEAGWRYQLTRHGRVLFWMSVLPLTAAQWYLAVTLVRSAGLLP